MAHCPVLHRLHSSCTGLQAVVLGFLKWHEGADRTDSYRNPYAGKWRKMDKDKGKGQVTEVIKVKVHCTLGESKVLRHEHLHKGNELVDFHAGVMGKAVDHLTRVKYEDLLDSRVRPLRRIAKALGRLKLAGLGQNW